MTMSPRASVRGDCLAGEAAVGEVLGEVVITFPGFRAHFDFGGAFSYPMPPSPCVPPFIVSRRVAFGQPREPTYGWGRTGEWAGC